MAVDKLVDSTELDNGLTTIADAIRTKGGTSAPLAFPDGMAQAIADIPTGITPTGNINITDTNVTDVTNYATAQVVDADLIASNIKKDVNILGVVGSFEGGGIPEWLQYAETLNGALYTGDNARHLPAELIVELPNATAAPLAFFNASSTSCRHITVIYKENASNIQLSSFAGGGGFKPRGVEKITLRAGTSNIIKVGDFVSAYIANADTVKELDCILDLSARTHALSQNANQTFGRGMETFRVKPNTLSVKNNNFSNSPALSDNTLTSLANGLKAGSATLTLHATSKGRLTAILGTVSQLTDDTGTYDFFTADASGTVTLENFITQTKGWTIA